MDGDGDMDIMGTAYTDDDVAWFENNGSQVFTERSIDGDFDGATVIYPVDIDGDGDPSGGHYGSVWLDFDNDRDVDMFIAKCGGESERRDNEMHVNNGDGTFTEIGASLNLEDDMQTWSSAWADYDNDGDFDLMIGAYYGNFEYYMNTGSASNPVFFGPVTNPFELSPTYEFNFHS